MKVKVLVILSGLQATKDPCIGLFHEVSVPRISVLGISVLRKGFRKGIS
jgi:hypothetical protein